MQSQFVPGSRMQLQKNLNIGLAVVRHPGQERRKKKASKPEDVWPLSVSAERRI